jgi:hypothetical protein
LSVTLSRPLSPPSHYRGRLLPRGGNLFVVRWIRDDGHEVLHRYFRRRVDAERCAARLADRGKATALFETATEWKAAP